MKELQAILYMKEDGNENKIIEEWKIQPNKYLDI